MTNHLKHIKIGYLADIEKHYRPEHKPKNFQEAKVILAKTIEYIYNMKREFGSTAVVDVMPNDFSGQYDLYGVMKMLEELGHEIDGLEDAVDKLEAVLHESD